MVLKEELFKYCVLSAWPQLHCYLGRGARVSVTSFFPNQAERGSEEKLLEQSGLPHANTQSSELGSQGRTPSDRLQNSRAIQELVPLISKHTFPCRAEGPGALLVYTDMLAVLICTHLSGKPQSG